MQSVARSVAVLLVLLVVASGCRSTAGGRTTGDVVDDTKITAAVKAKLVADRAANLTKVNVDTTNGVVQLRGTVDSAAQKSRAEQLAREASGVTRVVNNLQVVPR
jgi:hyperosmotically inducible protein